MNAHLLIRSALWLLILGFVFPTTACQTFEPTDWLTRQEAHEITELRVRHENARSFWGVRHFETALASKEKAQMAEAYRHFQAAARMRPDWDLPYLELAILHPIWDNDIGAEHAALERAVDLNPDNPRSRLMLGSVLVKLDQPQKAELHLEHALALRPTFDEARLRLAALYQESSRPERAIEHYEYLLNAQPENASLHGVLAELYEHKGDLERAENHLLALCRNFPRTARVFVTLAQFYQRQGRTEDAANALERARSLSPTEERSRRMRPLLPSRR